MASVKELLKKSLDDLRTDDLKLFQWHLKNHEHISASEMKNADVLHTVDKMVAHFEPEAVKITVDILRKMDQYLLAEELENKHKKGSTLVDSKADLHDYTAEVGTSHTCSSQKFSEPKPSGLNIQPLLNCQSCVHIADSDQWVKIKPLACTDEEGSKFRVSTDPGRYECVRTRMRWVCDCDVTLQYRTVDGHFLNAELERLQSNRIAPVMDVTVISGKLEEVHLPHYACLGESDPSLKDAVKLLTVQDEGITTEPVQLTRFHAKIVQPSFSLKTLIISWIKRWYEHCDLLLYMPYKDPLVLHVYIFPFDECEKKKVEKDEKSSPQIKYPRPDRPFQMKKPHILAVPGATIHPKEGITFRRETPPNFFKVKTRLENDIQMILIREEDQKTVWTPTIEKDELDQIHRKRDEPRLNSEADKAQFFDNHWPDLIQRVKTVGIIADKLHQQKIINEEQYSEITQTLTSQESMRKICDIIHKHSDAMKAKFISVLQKEELYLLEHLYDSAMSSSS